MSFWPPESQWGKITSVDRRTTKSGTWCVKVRYPSAKRKIAVTDSYTGYDTEACLNADGPRLLEYVNSARPGNKKKFRPNYHGMDDAVAYPPVTTAGPRRPALEPMKNFVSRQKVARDTREIRVTNKVFEEHGMDPINQATWRKLHSTYTREEKDNFIAKTCRRKLVQINAELLSLSVAEVGKQAKKITDFQLTLGTRCAELERASARCKELKLSLCQDVLAGVAWKRIFVAEEEEDDPDDVPEGEEKIGYVGKNKGIKQILWERGLWKEGMKLTQTEKQKLSAIMNNKPMLDPELNASLALGSCFDFANEKSALADLVEQRGHILLTSVKCHPEMAGGGIEYCWGFLKYTHRQNNEKQTEKRKGGAVFKQTVLTLCTNRDVLAMARIWKYQRRARDYHRLYIALPGDTVTSHGMLENMRKTYKTHRNIGEIERAHLHFYSLRLFPR